jgi:hypothetical protein
VLQYIAILVLGYQQYEKEKHNKIEFFLIYKQKKDLQGWRDLFHYTLPQPIMVLKVRQTSMGGSVRGNDMVNKSQNNNNNTNNNEDLNAPKSYTSCNNALFSSQKGQFSAATQAQDVCSVNMPLTSNNNCTINNNNNNNINN